MGLPAGSLVAFLVAVSFAAGLNVYATVATLGILARAGWVALPAGLGGLGDRWVIGASVALFCLEFVADKIPLFDVVWNAVHTFVRLPVAALMAYSASAHMSLPMQMLVSVAAAAVAGVAHGSKTAARVGVSVSPEPVSNMALSTVEDLAAVALTWVATRHPYVAGAVAVAGIIAAVLAARWIVRAIRREVSGMRGRFMGWGWD